MKIFTLVLLALSGANFLATPAHALISVAEKNAREARLKAQKEHKTDHEAKKPARTFTVVLDPGHGGIDHGTTYEGNPPVAEKDLTLILARNVAARLKARGIHVIMTRDGDYEMPLAARTALANQKHADVFLSIHLNSTPGQNTALAEGVETYILNHESNSTDKRLATLENRVIGGGEVAKEGEDVALILKDLRLDATLPESKRLACMIQSRVAAIDPKLRLKDPRMVVTSNRGVRQALFFVLLGADMPSALVEAGFLSNAHDRAWLLSLSGQRAFGEAVARAINLFRLQKNTLEARKIMSTCKVH